MYIYTPYTISAIIKNVTLSFETTWTDLGNIRQSVKYLACRIYKIQISLYKNTLIETKPMVTKEGKEEGG